VTVSSSVSVCKILILRHARIALHVPPYGSFGETIVSLLVHLSLGTGMPKDQLVMFAIATHRPYAESRFLGLYPIQSRTTKLPSCPQPLAAT
jgi:hypothetical protein